MDRKQLLEHGRKALEHMGWGVTWGTYEGKPFGIVDGWDTLHKLWTELVYAAGLEQCYAEAVTFAAAKTERWNRCQPYTLSDGREVMLITDERIGRNKRFPGDDESLYLVPDAVQEAELPEVYAMLLSGRAEGEDGEDGWGFYDEYQLCDDCNNNIFRTSADSWGWTPQYYEDPDTGERICPDCVDVDDLLQKYNHKPRNLPCFVDREENGLVVLEDLQYENGLHGGQTDDPKAIAKLMKEQGIDLWFDVSPGQFDVTFYPIVRAADEQKARAALEGADTSCGYDPAEVMKKGLAQASAAMSAVPPGPGPVVTTITNVDGQAEVKTRRVSPEDFIAGKALDG